jgi:predicted kinase
MRGALVNLFSDYKAKTTIVYCETSEAKSRRRNALRERPVPESAIRRTMEHWEPPDVIECHALQVVLG